MRRDFITAPPTETLPEVRQTMRLARLRHLIVVHGDKLVGIVSYRDLLEELLDRRPGKEKRGEKLFEAMVTSPDFVTPDTPLEEAARRLYRHRVGCLPVVAEDSERLVGLITELDLLKAAYF